MKHTLPQPADTPMVEKPLILGRSVVAMVQPTQAPPRNHLTTTHRPGPISRCSFTQPEVRAVVVVVREVIGEESFQVSLVQRNGLVEQFASAAPYPALRDLRFARDFEQRFVRRRSSWIESQPERPTHTLRRGQR